MIARIQKDIPREALVLQKEVQGSFLERVSDFIEPRPRDPHDWAALSWDRTHLTIRSKPADRAIEIEVTSIKEIHFLIEERVSWVHPIRCSFLIGSRPTAYRLLLFLYVENIDSIQKAKALIFRIAAIIGRVSYQEHYQDPQFYWLSLEQEAPAQQSDDPYRGAPSQNKFLPLPKHSLDLSTPSARGPLPDAPHPNDLPPGVTVTQWEPGNRLGLSLEKDRGALDGLLLLFTNHELQVSDKKKTESRSLFFLEPRILRHSFGDMGGTQRIATLHLGDHLINTPQQEDAKDVFQRLYPLTDALSKALDLPWKMNLLEQTEQVLGCALTGGYALALTKSKALYMPQNGTMRLHSLPLPIRRLYPREDGSVYIICSGYQAAAERSLIFSCRPGEAPKEEWRGSYLLEDLCESPEGATMAIGENSKLLYRDKPSEVWRSIQPETKLPDWNIQVQMRLLATSQRFFLWTSNSDLFSSVDRGHTWTWVDTFPGLVSMCSTPRGALWLICKHKIIELNENVHLSAPAGSELYALLEVNGYLLVLGKDAAKGLTFFYVWENRLEAMQRDNLWYEVGVQLNAQSQFTEGLPREFQWLHKQPLRGSRLAFVMEHCVPRSFFAADGGVYITTGSYDKAPILFVPLWALERG